MNDRTGLSSGDRNRNARLARLAEDLVGDKQAAVVTDHDSRLLARLRVTARAWELGELLDWAVVRAKAAGVRFGNGGMRADRAPVAGAGPARRGAPPYEPDRADAV